MANLKPYMTSNDFVDFVKLSMAFPLDQSTFQYNDILNLANKEMEINAVPTMMELNEEYFSFKTIVPIVSNISKYDMPNRAMGMVLRDVKYSDQQGNFNDMTRISPEDKAFFQNNTGVNQVISKYYLEGNQLVLTPQTNVNPTGNLNFWFFLRPNQLVRNDRACIIQNFVKNITITDYTQIVPGDTITIVVNAQSVNPIVHTLFAVNNSAQTITSNSIDPNATVITTDFDHNIPAGVSFQVVISGVSGSTPSINGVWSATSTGVNTFSIPVATSASGTGGSYEILGQFVIDISNPATAINLSTAMTLQGLTNTVALNVVTMMYNDISTSFQTAEVITNDVLFGVIDIDINNIYIQFDQLPTTYTDLDTQVTSSLYSNGCLVDFLQTLPGHRTYNFDVTLQSILPGNIGKFPVSQLMTYNTNGSGGPQTFFNIIVGDYICLQNECIIPQIPPELHSALAERTCSRILMAIGDRDGYAVSQAKIAEMNKAQDIMLSNRVEGSNLKVFNRYNLLRMGKLTVRRRLF